MSAADSLATTVLQVIEFLNEQSIRLQDEPGVEVLSQWIEELPKLVLAERERSASQEIAVTIRSGK